MYVCHDRGVWDSQVDGPTTSGISICISHNVRKLFSTPVCMSILSFSRSSVQAGYRTKSMGRRR